VLKLGVEKSGVEMSFYHIPWFYASFRPLRVALKLAGKPLISLFAYPILLIIF
jgi:hypothetical protein